jgi:tetratricopeptide (TPR) repeat protein
VEQDYNVWFGKRLKEVMDHFGMTAKSLGEQSGVGRMTISRIVQGRYATAEEVKKIAETLGITVERLKQKDVEFPQIVHNRITPEIEDALDKAQDALAISLGKTEIAEVHVRIGVIYFRMHKFEKSLEAHRNALALVKESENLDLILNAYNGLMWAYTMMRDFDALNNVYEEVKEVFRASRSMLQLALFLHSEAAHLIEYEKRHEEALETFRKALEIYLELDNHANARRVLMNMGDVCFRMYRFEMAREFMEQAFQQYPNAEPDKYIELYHYKDYIKVLFSVGDVERAREVLEQHVEKATNSQIPEIRNFYLVLSEMIYGDGAAAKKMLDLDGVKVEFKLLAGMMLSSALSKQGEHDEARFVLSKLLADHLILE